MVLHLNPHLISFQTKELWVWHCSAKGIQFNIILSKNKLTWYDTIPSVVVVPLHFR